MSTSVSHAAHAAAALHHCMPVGDTQSPACRESAATSLRGRRSSAQKDADGWPDLPPARIAKERDRRHPRRRREGRDTISPADRGGRCHAATATHLNSERGRLTVGAPWKTIVPRRSLPRSANRSIISVSPELLNSSDRTACGAMRRPSRDAAPTRRSPR
jgi:hypothetical protein